MANPESPATIAVKSAIPHTRVLRHLP